MTDPNRPGETEPDASWNLPPDRAPPPNPEAAPGADHADRSDERTMALLAWALMLAGIVTFIAGIAAVIVAYVRRGDADPLWRSHYDGVVRMFWIWLVLTLIGAPLTLLLVGYPILAIAAIWTAAVGIRGLFRASENRAN